MASIALPGDTSVTGVQERQTQESRFDACRRNQVPPTNEQVRVSAALSATSDFVAVACVVLGLDPHPSFGIALRRVVKLPLLLHRTESQ